MVDTLGLSFRIFTANYWVPEELRHESICKKTKAQINRTADQHPFLTT